MKKQFIISLLALPFAASTQQPAIVEGKYNKSKTSALTLYEVKDGERQEFARTQLSEGNRFAFQLPAAKAGFYYLATDPQRGGNRIYLAPGTKLQLTITDSSVELNSGNTENKLLQEWETLRAPLRAISKSLSNDNSKYRRLADTGTFLHYFPLLQEMLPKAEAFKKKINSSNKPFNDLLRFTIDADMQIMAVQFLLQPRTKHPQKTDYPSFYRSIANTNLLNTTRIYALGEGQDFLSAYPTFKYIMASQLPEKDKMFDFTLEQVANDTLKGDVLAKRLAGARSYEEVVSSIEQYGQFLKTERQKRIKEEAMDKLVKFQKGAPGYNFELPDIDGKKVSLKSLAGKVVVVDVWATWCGPCKAEIPHLKTLSDEMKGKDVVFVSIGTDKEADKEKWKKFVEEHELDGVQLYDPSGKSVITYYKIPGIPRFMVFDKKGNIVSVDAPRPSTPELKKLIEQYL